MRIALGSDERNHVTDYLVENLEGRGYDLILFGPLQAGVVAGDENGLWPVVAHRVAQAVAGGEVDEGIVCCWTGTGVSMAANKVAGIRAALCHDAQTAAGARLWNRANVLALSLRLTSAPLAKEILDAWFSTPLGEDPVDVRCVAYLSELEKTPGEHA